MHGLPKAKRPSAITPHVGVSDAGMAHEIGQAFRTAVAIEILRCGDKKEAACSQLACDQGGIIKTADPDRNIDAFGGEVDETVGQPEVNRQIGMRGTEAVEQGADKDFTKGHRGRDPQRVYVLIPGEEVKNDRPYHLELPGEVADLIAWYCMEYRALLVEVPTTALFPGERGGSKKPSTLGPQITKRVQAYLGVPVNPHLFRHIAAKLYLDHRPGEYALVSRLLNHKSVATTMRAYTGTESVSAARHYQNLVQGLRVAGGKTLAKKVAR